MRWEMSPSRILEMFSDHEVFLYTRKKTRLSIFFVYLFCFVFWQKALVKKKKKKKKNMARLHFVHSLRYFCQNSSKTRGRILGVWNCRIFGSVSEKTGLYPKKIFLIRGGQETKPSKFMTALYYSLCLCWTSVGIESCFSFKSAKLRFQSF